MAIKHCTGKYLVAALGVLAFAASANAAAPASALPDFSALVETYGPAVVNVQVSAQAPQRGAERQGEGSGFIVSADGYILTNRHVVQGASEVTVRLLDRREYNAKVIGMDDTTDVAVLKIEGRNLPIVRMGDPEKLRPGEWVVAIGSPFGMENSVTAGIVSATARHINGQQFVPFIQTDVAVNPGNSGGPLFNLRGEVVGINSQIFSQTGGYMGLSFAIPIDMADNVRQQLISTGKVTRGRIGVEVQSLTANSAQSFNLDRPRGALVANVVKGEAADKAGILAGDIILGIGGKPLPSEVLLPSMVAAIKPGTSTEFEIWRDGKSRTVTVNVGELQNASPRANLNSGRNGGNTERSAGTQNTVLGLALRPLTAQERQQASTTGWLVIDGVSGPATRAGIRRGDILLGVGSVAVNTVDELRTAVEKNVSRHVPLRVQRGDSIQFAPVQRE